MEWFRYVPHAELPAHIAQGWEVTDALADTHHGRHATLCRWTGPGEPPAEPQIDQIDAGIDAALAAIDHAADMRLVARALQRLRLDTQPEVAP